MLCRRYVHFFLKNVNISECVCTIPHMSADEVLILHHKGRYFRPLSAAAREKWLTELKLDVNTEEQYDIHTIMRSRKDIGCICMDKCDPHSCPCKMAGIECHPGTSCTCSPNCEDCKVYHDPLVISNHYRQTKRRLLQEGIEQWRKTDEYQTLMAHGKQIAADRSAAAEMTEHCQQSEDRTSSEHSVQKEKGGLSA